MLFILTEMGIFEIRQTRNRAALYVEFNKFRAIDANSPPGLAIYMRSR